MSINPQTQQQESGSSWSQKYLPPLAFLLIAIAGIFYVKWNPYYHKAFLAASKHSIGASIISGKSAKPPAASWGAALDYAKSYFNAVWQAVILGLLLGSLIQVLIPKDWVNKLLGRTSLSSTLTASAVALPSMMCTCCAAPVTVGFRKQSASAGAAMGYFLASPLLNPATLIFMGFVLSWKFVVLRVVLGAFLVLLIGYLANRLSKNETTVDKLTLSNDTTTQESFLMRWLRALGKLILDTIPAYVIVVLLLGAARAWLFPVTPSNLANSLIVIVGLAIAGTLFVIPTAAEIPVIQTLMHFGLGMGPATTLLITLPALSLPSLLIIRPAFSWRILITAMVAVILTGILSGLVVGLIM